LIDIEVVYVMNLSRLSNRWCRSSFNNSK